MNANQNWKDCNIIWGAKSKNPIPNSVLLGTLANYGEYSNGPGMPSWDTPEEGSDRLMPNNPALTDTSGWNKPAYYETIQCADIDGDGQAELIARGAYSICVWKCDRNTRQWNQLPNGPGWKDGDGWAKPAYYETIQCADIDGDGQAELIAKNAFYIEAWKYDRNTRQWNQLPNGPILRDQDGWNKPEYYKTIQCADIDHGARGCELIARGSGGVLTYWWTYTNDRRNLDYALPAPPSHLKIIS